MKEIDDENNLNIKNQYYDNLDNVKDLDCDDDILDISDDDELDFIIEVDDDIILDNEDVKNDNDDNDDDLDVGESIEYDDVVLSKHKMEGKHSLKYDTIFKGKKDENISDVDIESVSFYYKDNIEVDKSSNYHLESINNEEYIRSKHVKEKVYHVLKSNTNINFSNNRRKPSKIDFNHYYELLKNKLINEKFTNVELFNELSFYFSDNLFNMFKLLDNKWRNQIIQELQDHIGKDANSKDIKNRNIYEGTEIEFIWCENEFGDEKLITGVVLEVNYENSIFKIDSYENVYIIHISSIKKILNNAKFKFNLNKLNNIDFL